MSSPRVIPASKALDLYKQGKLSATIEELIKEVRVNPTDTWLRTFLFEVLLFNGELDRAERQLKAISIGDAKNELGLMIYENNLRAERMRQKVFNGEAMPEFLMETPKYINYYIEAIKALKAKNYQGIKKELAQAEKMIPALEGTLNGIPFQDFRDYYDLSAAYLEIFLQDRYIWLPFEQILSIDVKTPQHLRDLFWVQARIKTIDESIGEFFLPALYPNSYKHENELVRLGRLTDWAELSSHLYQGFGLRTFLVGNEEKTIFNLQTLELVKG